MNQLSRLALCAATLALSATTLLHPAMAAPVKYDIDPSHTYPTFEADHMGGLSLWRGKINKSSGTITLDTVAQAGTVAVTMDMSSIDFGLDKMNEHAQSAEIFDIAKYPAATYQGELKGFKKGSPTKVVGNLTLHGVTKPVELTIKQFLCKENPMSKKEVCGADAQAIINRSDFGVSYGADYGFKQQVTLRISVEAIRAD